MYALTEKQRSVLDAIRDLTVDGVAPTFAEIMARTGISSRGNVHAIMTKLEDRGHIRRRYGCARAIEIIGEPLQGMSRSALLALRDEIDYRLSVAV